MRIGISCYPTLGGSGAVATELGKALAHKGHEVHFIVANVPFRLGEFHPNIYIHEMETTTYPVLRTPPYDFSLAALMANVISEHKLDILHTHYALPFAVCGFLAREMLGSSSRVRHVTTLHGTDITVLAQDKSLLEVIRLGIEKSDAVTAVSQSLAQQTRDLFQIDKPIDCVYNFVNPNVFHPCGNEAVRQRFAAPGEKLLLHISNFRKVKRLPDVIEVFRQVLQAIPAKLLLVGEGPELADTHTLARELGIQDKVLFLGKQDEVAELFACADLLLLPSEKESFGLVALEAMAAGLPVIGSTAGGLPEVVVNGETGWLAEVGDVATMARLAAELLSHPDQYERFSAQARQRAVQTFHVDTKVAEYEAIYQTLLAGNRP